MIQAARLFVVAAMVLAVLQLSTGTSHAVQFCNTAPIIGTTGTGPSALYPSPIVVSGLTGTITDVNMSLLDFNTRGDNNSPPQHWAEDLDVMASGPDGSNVILMSDAGGNNDVSSGAVVHANLTFDDQAANQLPANSLITSGTWRPVNDTDVAGDSPDVWDPPAPTPSGSTMLSTFNGKNPNGTWNLWVVDDTQQAAGDFNGGWCVDILTTGSTTAPPTTAPPTTAPPTTAPPTTAPPTTAPPTTAPPTTAPPTTAPPTTAPPTTAPPTTAPPTTAPPTTAPPTTAPPTTAPPTTAPPTTAPPTTAPPTTAPPTTAPPTTSPPTTRPPTTLPPTTLPGPPKCDGKVATIVGTPGNDNIIGTPGDDVIVGLGGDDTIQGLGGNDTICGGDGNDQIDGGAGNDRLFGGNGNDRLIGGSGNNALFGEAGNDQCFVTPTSTAATCEQILPQP